MSGRDVILAAIRANAPAPRPYPEVPMFDEGRRDDLPSRFMAAFRSMGGTELPADPRHPSAPLSARIAQVAGRRDAVIVSRVPEVAGTRPLDPDIEPASLDDVDVAVVRAAFGVAETGSIALTEAELGTNTLGYLAQHLIALLDPDDIVANIHHAYQRPEFARANYLVFHTGPSATADIEGVLIHGAQGVRSLSVLLLPR